MLGVHARGEGRYFEIVEKAEVSLEAGRARGYYSRDVEAGASPGRLIGTERGLGALGLSVGGQVSKEVTEALYTKLQHPTTGEALGTRPRHFASPAENLAKVAVREGIELPEALRPEALSAVNGRASAAAVAAAIAPHVAPERLAEMRREAEKDQRAARTLIDLTFSQPKEWSVLYFAALERGEDAYAQDVVESLRIGIEAAMDKLVSEVVPYARTGYNGLKAVDATGYVATAYEHLFSREGDPMLHTHVALLNRVLCDDGRWLSVDTKAIYEARLGLDALFLRSAEAELSRRRGVRFSYDPTIKARRIVGVDRGLVDLLSKRTAAIEARLDAWTERFVERNGYEPTPKQRDAAARRISLVDRKAKPAEYDTLERVIAGWNRELDTARHKGLGMAFDAVVKASRQLVAEAKAARRQVPAIDEASVLSRAIAAVGERSSWSRHDLKTAIDREMPEDLGGLGATEIDALLERLTRAGLCRPEVAALTAPAVIGEFPGELLLGNGRPIYAPRDRTLYALTETLDKERRLVARALRSGAPGCDQGVARARVKATSMRPDQAAAVAGILSSKRRLDVLIGPAGAGKSYALAELARLWQSEVGGDVFGLATSEAATKVLAAEGIKKSANITRWLAIQERIGGGRTLGRDRRFSLGANSLVVLDEASMTSTADLENVCARVEAAGGKVVLAGDHHQLGAVTQGGSLRLVATDADVVRAGGVHELTAVARFEAAWERDASLGLRLAESAAVVAYDHHGRIHGGSAAEMNQAAYEAGVGDLLAGRNTLVLVGTNEQAASLSMRIRAELVSAGRVSDVETVRLFDGALAGAGDLIQCRAIDRKVIEPTGEGVSNRDNLRVLGVGRGGRLLVCREDGRGFILPAAYVSASVALAYAATAHGAQGRTVERAYAVVDGQSGREFLYVALTRGRETNMAFVVTEPVELDAIGQDRTVERDAVGVLSDVLSRPDGELTATEALREAVEAAESLKTLGPIWADVCGQLMEREQRKRLEVVVGRDVLVRIDADDAAPAFWAAVSDARAKGYDVSRMLPAVAARRELDSAESVAQVLHWRVGRYMAETAPERPEMKLSGYMDRTPQPEGLEMANLAGGDALQALAGRVAVAMDRRVEALGERLAQDPPLWASVRLGELPAPGADQEAWKARAGAVAAYVEQYGPPRALGDHELDPIGLAPSPALSLQRYRDWQLADEALGHPNRAKDMAMASDSELRLRVAAWHKTQEAAPDYVVDELRQAVREIQRRELALERLRAVPGFVEGRGTEAKVAELTRLRETVTQLEATQVARDKWWEATTDLRLEADVAAREYRRRHPDSPLRVALAPESLTVEERLKLERRAAEARLAQTPEQTMRLGL